MAKNVVWHQSGGDIEEKIFLKEDIGWRKKSS
jgi:hypothetical protein